jgi:hypothetical protein
MKFYGITIILLTTCFCSRVNAQLQFKQGAADNFTAVTPEKTYSDVAKRKARTPPVY